MKLNIILALLALSALAMAHEGGTYHRYYGTVTINGQAAPDRTEIMAESSSGFVKDAVVIKGKYYLEFEDLPDGDTITFSVEGVETTTVTSGSEENTLDLAMVDETRQASVLQFIPFALAAVIAIAIFFMRKSMSQTVMIALGIAAIGMLAFGALSFTAPAQAHEEPLVLTGETKTFDIVARQWVFEPSVIKVNRGDKVVLRVTSSDVPHSMALMKYDIIMSAEPGVVDEAEFIAEDGGELTFFCSVPCGDGHTRMIGKLIVE